MTKNFIKPEITIEMFNGENILTESAVSLQTTMSTFVNPETTVVNISENGGTDFSVFDEQN